MSTEPGDIQGGRSLLQQLRSEYPTIAQQESKTSSVELDATLGGAEVLLHAVGDAAGPYDYLFIADAYRHDVHPEIALALYKKALAGLGPSQPTIYRLEALRGLAAVYWGFNSLGMGRREFAAAIQAADSSHDPSISRADDDSITNGLWAVQEAAIPNNCNRVLTHIAAFERYASNLPVQFGGPSAVLIALVQKAGARCRPQPRPVLRYHRPNSRDAKRPTKRHRGASKR